MLSEDINFIKFLVTQGCQYTLNLKQISEETIYISIRKVMYQQDYNPLRADIYFHFKANQISENFIMFITKCNLYIIIESHPINFNLYNTRQKNLNIIMHFWTLLLGRNVQLKRELDSNLIYR